MNRLAGDVSVNELLGQHRGEQVRGKPFPEVQTEQQSFQLGLAILSLADQVDNDASPKGAACALHQQAADHHLIDELVMGGDGIFFWILPQHIHRPNQPCGMALQGNVETTAAKRNSWLCICLRCFDAVWIDLNAQNGQRRIEDTKGSGHLQCGQWQSAKAQIHNRVWAASSKQLAVHHGDKPIDSAEAIGGCFATGGAALWAGHGCTLGEGVRIFNGWNG